MVLISSFIHMNVSAIVASSHLLKFCVFFPFLSCYSFCFHAKQMGQRCCHCHFNCCCYCDFEWSLTNEKIKFFFTFHSGNVGSWNHVRLFVHMSFSFLWFILFYCLIAPTSFLTARMFIIFQIVFAKGSQRISILPSIR